MTEAKGLLELLLEFGVDLPDKWMAELLGVSQPEYWRIRTGKHGIGKKALRGILNANELWAAIPGLGLAINDYLKGVKR